MTVTTKLNPAQQQAVEHIDGPLVIFAGAGSGKTRVITERIAHLIKNGVPARSILAVTFTNKAAGEMYNRVLDKCGSSAFGCVISTFHSACARWLREFATELGFTSDFTIFDESDADSALKHILKEVVSKSELASILSETRRFIHYVKTWGWFPVDVEKMSHQLQAQRQLPTGGVWAYKRYQEYLAQCNAMDFDDLLMNALLLMRRNERVRDILQARYRYVMVDEYQDTNRTQFELIQTLCAKHRNLCVVGDDDQSIYSWRGATPANILDFDKTYPEAKKVTLEQNYRCTSNIVDAASAMIANNRKRVAKTLFTNNPPGDSIDVMVEADGELEAHAIVAAIQTEAPRFSLADIAIFYRTNSQSRALEDALRRANIPYQIFGSVRFYDRMEIKDIVAYMRLLTNPKDDISAKRIINVPTRGIGDTAVQQVEKEAASRGLSFLDAVQVLAQEGVPRLSSKLKVFVQLHKHLQERMAGLRLDGVVDAITSVTEYHDYLKKKFPDQAEDKIDNVHELANALALYESNFPESTLQEWLQSVSLTNAADDMPSSGVSMMTLHTAKGLEYKRVFIAGVEEGLLPHRSSVDNADDCEEERRLFYVGMTRAREKLSLLCAYRRRTFDQTSYNQPSRFLREIPDKYLSGIEVAGSNSRADGYSDPYTGVSYDYGGSAAEDGQIETGNTVSHPTYGKGTVEHIERDFSGFKVTVHFDEFGLRKVSLHHLSVR